MVILDPVWARPLAVGPDRGHALPRHRRADILADAGVTKKLETGRLVVSLKNVAEVKNVVALSAEAGACLIDLAK